MFRKHVLIAFFIVVIILYTGYVLALSTFNFLEKQESLKIDTIVRRITERNALEFQKFLEIHVSEIEVIKIFQEFFKTKQYFKKKAEMFISQNPGLEALWISSKEKRWLVTKKRFKDDVNLDFKGSLASIAIDMEPYFLSKVALSSATYAIGLFSVEHAFEQALPKQPQGIEFFIRNQGGSFFHIHQSRTGDPINRNIRHEMKFEIMGTKWDMAGFPTVNMTALYKTNVPYMAAGVVFAFFVLLSGFMLIIMYLALISTSNNELKKGIIELAEIIIVLSRKIT